MNRIYFTPAWMFGSSWVISPTFRSFPVAGMIWMVPTAPIALFAFWSSSERRADLLPEAQATVAELRSVATATPGSPAR